MSNCQTPRPTVRQSDSLTIRHCPTLAYPVSDSPTAAQHESCTSIALARTRHVIRYHPPNYLASDSHLHIAFLAADARVSSGAATLKQTAARKAQKSLLLLSRALSGFQEWIWGFPKGLPTTSLQFLQVSEAESQSVMSCERFQVSVAIMLSMDIKTP